MPAREPGPPLPTGPVTLWPSQLPEAAVWALESDATSWERTVVIVGAADGVTVGVRVGSTGKGTAVAGATGSAPQAGANARTVTSARRTTDATRSFQNVIIRALEAFEIPGERRSGHPDMTDVAHDGRVNMANLADATIRPWTSCRP